MTRDEIAQFEKITGEKGWNTPTGEIGRFLDGYERGCNKTIDHILEIIDKIGSRAEILDMDAYEVYTEIRFGVLDLKGEQG